MRPMNFIENTDEPEKGQTQIDVFKANQHYFKRYVLINIRVMTNCDYETSKTHNDQDNILKYPLLQPFYSRSNECCVSLFGAFNLNVESTLLTAFWRF